MTASTNGSQTATVETLVAEVRTLMIGGRQVTMSVYKQLDCVSPWEIEPFGRVRSGIKRSLYPGAPQETADLEVVGRCLTTGTLVRCVVWDADLEWDPLGNRRPARWAESVAPLHKLPLIVLAGLR